MQLLLRNVKPCTQQGTPDGSSLGLVTSAIMACYTGCTLLSGSIRRCTLQNLSTPQETTTQETAGQPADNLKMFLRNDLLNGIVEKQN